MSSVAPKEILHYTEYDEYKIYKHQQRMSRLMMLVATVGLIIIVAGSFYIGVQCERNGWLDNNKWLGIRTVESTAPKFIKI